MRTPETTGKLQILQNFSVLSATEGIPNLSSKDSPVYVGMVSHTSRIEEKKAKGKKKEENVQGSKTGKEKNIVRKFEDGLLLVVPTRIYGKEVKALIDSGATRCFCVSVLCS